MLVDDRLYLKLDKAKMRQLKSHSEVKLDNADKMLVVFFVAVVIIIMHAR
jgi:hypothetical protein